MVSFLYALMKVDAEIWLSHISFHERALIKKNRKKMAAYERVQKASSFKAGGGEGRGKGRGREAHLKKEEVLVVILLPG